MPPETPRLRILWILPKFPLGEPDGARHATCTLVRSLTRKGVDVHLICLIPKGQQADAASAKKQLGVSGCSLLTRSPSKFFPLPGWRTPFTFRAFAAPAVQGAFQEEVDRLLKDAPDEKNTFLVFDGLHGFAALNPSSFRAFTDRCAGLVYRAHNHETSLWEQCVDRARWPWTRWFFRYQAALVRAFERRIVRDVALIAPVSDEDGDRFALWAPGTPASVTPIGMDFPTDEAVPPVALQESLPLLFVGRLDWLPNRAGLQWFLENIWPPLCGKRSGVTLQVAGTGDGRWLERFAALPGLSLLGRVERLEPLYASCALAIAPIFQGSGTRVKILESARYGRAVLTTALGAEGLGLIPGATCHQAESREAWLDFLATVTSETCRDTGLKAFQDVRERFDAGAIAGRLMDALKRRKEPAPSDLRIRQPA